MQIITSARHCSWKSESEFVSVLYLKFWGICAKPEKLGNEPTLTLILS